MKKIKDNIISIEEAIKLLCNNDYIVPDTNIFDIYGNYSFPTDITMDTPNSAFGTISALLLTDKN